MSANPTSSRGGQSAQGLAAALGPALIPWLLVLALPLPVLAGKLQEAARRGDSEMVQRLLEGGAEVDEPGAGDGTALHVASYEGHLRVVQTLLAGGADVRLAADGGRTALHLAALKSHPAISRVLLEAGAKVDQRDADGVTPLGLAVASCDVETAELLIQSGAKVNARFYGGATVLHGLPYAERAADHRAMFELLVAAGADIETETVRERNTPLDVAAMFGDYDVVDALLAAGADVNHANAFGARPLHGAAAAGQARIASLLLENGADVDAVDEGAMTALHWAAAQGEIKKGRGMQDFVTWRRGGKPLPHDYVATARVLIDHGSPLNARDGSGRTPQEWAKKKREPRMIALLEGK